MIDKRLLSKRFSEHAQTYDAYANVQKNMAKQLVDLLPQKTPTTKPTFFKPAAAPVPSPGSSSKHSLTPPFRMKSTT